MVLIFDDSCPLCRAFVASLKRMSTPDRVRCRPLQDESVFTDFPQLDRSVCMEDIHLVDTDGVVHVGAAVLEVLAEPYPMVRHLSTLLLPTGQTAAEAAHAVASAARRGLRGADRS